VKPAQPRVHRLKTIAPYFTDVVVGRKTFEVRQNDRDFLPGDILLLEEYVPKGERYTGSFAVRRVTYILHGPAFGIAAGYVVMGIEPCALTDGVEARSTDNASDPGGAK